MIFMKIVKALNDNAIRPQKNISNWLDKSLPYLPVIIFIAGYFINKHFENWKRDAIKKERLNYFISLIKSAKGDAEKLCSKIDGNILKINQNIYHFYPLEIVSFLEAKRVSDKLNIEEYFQSFIRQYGNNDKRIDQFKKIINAFDFLTIYFDNLVDYIEGAGNNYYKMTTEVNRLTKEIDATIPKISEWLIYNSPANLSTNFTIVRDKYYNTSHLDSINIDEYLKILQESLLIPFLSIMADLKKIGALNAETPIAFTLLLEKTIHQLHLIKLFNGRHAKELEARKATLMEGINILKENSVDIMNNLKANRWFYIKRNRI